MLPFGTSFFLSTATVFAKAAQQPLDEGAPMALIGPYARSKSITEWMLEDVSRATSLRHIVLRYFNVCGADPIGRTGQVSRIPTDLIKRASMVALGRISHLYIFGADYPSLTAPACATISKSPISPTRMSPR
jgi:UDP-glucose 4-epimerase